MTLARAVSPRHSLSFEISSPAGAHGFGQVSACRIVYSESFPRSSLSTRLCFCCEATTSQ